MEVRLHVPDTVLLISDDPAGRGGTEIRLLQTAMSLSRDRWRPLVIVPTDGYLYRMLKGAGVDTRLLNFYRFPRFWRVRRHFPIDAWVTILVNMVRFRRILKQERVSLVHTVAKQTFNVRNVAWAARTMGVPVIWSCGDTNPQVLTYCRRGLGSMLDRVIAISHHVKDALVRFGLEPSDNIEVLHNAIDLEDWDKQTSAMDGSLREELGVPADRPIVGLVARLDRVKGQDAFLLAAAEVARAHPSALFLLVGVIRPTSRWAVFADYFREVKALAERPALRGRVIFTGWRDDLPRVMATVDILVQPSRRETFGRVLIEAMASRKPAIVTRVGGMPEIVVDDETGFVVAPEEPSGLAAAILRLLQDPASRRAMGEAGRMRVEQHFSLPQRIRRLESIYHQVLDTRAAEHKVRPCT